MSPIESCIIYALIISCVSSYSFIDIQDDAEAYDTTMEKEPEIKKKEQDVLIVKDELESSNLLKIIQGKLENLENTNKELKNQLEKTQNELSYKLNEVKRKNVPTVHLVTKYEEDKKESEANGFWTWICRITKGFLGGFLRLFNIHI